MGSVQRPKNQFSVAMLIVTILPTFAFAEEVITVGPEDTLVIEQVPMPVPETVDPVDGRIELRGGVNDDGNLFGTIGVGIDVMSSIGVFSLVPQAGRFGEAFNAGTRIAYGFGINEANTFRIGPTLDMFLDFEDNLTRLLPGIQAEMLLGNFSLFAAFGVTTVAAHAEDEEVDAFEAGVLTLGGAFIF